MDVFRTVSTKTRHDKKLSHFIGTCYAALELKTTASAGRRLRMYLVRGALYKTVSRRSGHIYFVWESWAKLPLAQDLQLPTFWPHPL